MEIIYFRLVIFMFNIARLRGAAGAATLLSFPPQAPTRNYKPKVEIQLYFTLASIVRIR